MNNDIEALSKEYEKNILKIQLIRLKLICAQLNMELKRHNEKVKRHRLIAIFVGFFIGVVIVLGVKCLKIY